MLQAYRGVAPQPLLRGSLEGIEPSQARALLPRFRRGVLTHVVLHDRLEARHADRQRDVRSELKAAGFKKELIQANVRRLRKLVSRLEPKRGRSEWAGYREAAPYSDEDADRKERFVREAGSARLAWDLGANDGRFSRALDAEYVLAVDGDERVVGELYTALRAEGSKTILPLVVDLADASPARGWRGARAAPARGARPAGPRALPRARPPPRDRPQRPVRRARRVAAERSARGW